MNLNEFYLAAKKQGIVSNERAHADVKRPSKGIGLVASLMVRFDCRALNGEIFKIHHAYAAVAVFDDLPLEQYEKIVHDTLARHGHGQVAEMSALKELYARPEAILILRDMKVMHGGAPDFVSLVDDMRVFNKNHIESFSRTLARGDVLTLLKDFDAEVLVPERFLKSAPTPSKSMSM